MPATSPGLLAGNPPPRWGAPGEDLAHATRRAQARAPLPVPALATCARGAARTTDHTPRKAGDPDERPPRAGPSRPPDPRRPDPRPATGARALPIYQTTSYVFNDTDHAANLFALKEFGNIYTRIMNPTQDAVEQRIAGARGRRRRPARVLRARPPRRSAMLNIAEAGDHIVVQPQPLRRHVQPASSTRCRSSASRSTFVDDPDDLDAGARPSGPTPSSSSPRPSPTPSSDVLDIEGVAGVAHEAGVPLIVDNTVATPYLIRPMEWGADIVVHSATKYLGGHGTSIGGVIVDGGTFDFGADPAQFPDYNEPDPSYHGLVYGRDLGVGSPLGANLVVHPQGAGAAAARPRPGHLAVQRLPHLPGHRDAQPADRASRRQRPHGRRVAAGPRRGAVGGLRVAAVAARGTRWRASTRPRGAGAVVAFEIEGGLEAGQEVRRGAGAAQRTWPTSATCARW